jgi:PilZ domain
MNPFLRKPSFSRRRTSRVDTVEGVSVYWRCNSREDVSSVGDLSFGGLFIKTRTPRSVGAPVEIDFLVEEGQIRAEGVVRHLEPAGGLGLKFTAMPDADRPRLAMLITRLRHCSRSAAAT